MTILITLTIAGTDAGPFDLYSDIDAYGSPFEVGIDKAILLAGYISNLVPNGTNIVRIKSTGDCINYVDIPVSTTTTSTTPSPYCYLVEAIDGEVYFSYINKDATFVPDNYITSSPYVSATVCARLGSITQTAGAGTISITGPGVLCDVTPCPTTTTTTTLAL